MEDRVKKWEKDFFIGLSSYPIFWAKKAMLELHASHSAVLENIERDEGITVDPVENDDSELIGIKLRRVYSGESSLFSIGNMPIESEQNQLYKILDGFLEMTKE